MRQLVTLLIVICACGFAAAQSNQTLPGAYAQPFTPRLATPSASPEALVTPSLTLDTPPLAVGASAETLSRTGLPVYVNQPTGYAPGVRFNGPLEESTASAAPITAAVSGNGIELGAAMFQSSYGAAQLVDTAARLKAKRLYTNQDVASVNDTNGLIKFRGRQEHVN
ncbi:MAG: hypothetical protein WBQ64_05630 [Terriglobales bacterium]